MKKLLLILLCLPFIGFGQMATPVTSPSVVSSAGQSFANGNVIIDFTLGEITIATFTSGNTILTQGFHQDNLSVHTLTHNLNIKTKVYPNPTSNILIIELDKNIDGELLVYDTNGKLVITDKLVDQKQKQLNFSSLKQGNYFLHINSANRKSVYQINKSK